MPRKVSKRRKVNKLKKEENSSKKVSKTLRTKKYSSKKFRLDIPSVSKEIAAEVVKRLGLDLMGIKPEDLIDIIENIVEGIVENRSTKPSTESLLKRILAGRDHVKKAVAAKLLEKRGEDLSLEQLEFIISSAPELAGRAAPLLYRLAKKYNADHLIIALQSLWNKYGRRTPIRCPRCGFYAVTPDLTCMICGASLSEEEIKQSIDFINRLKRYLESAPISLIREIYQAGFVVLNNEIHAPSTAPHSGFRVELYLDRKERELVKNILKERGEL